MDFKNRAILRGAPGGLTGFARYLTSTSQTAPRFRFAHFDVADKQHNPGGGCQYV